MTSIVRQHLVGAWLFGASVMVGMLIVLGGARPVSADRVDDKQLVASVAPLDLKAFDAASQDVRTRESLQTYYDSVLDWARVLGEEYEPVPGRPGQGYYGDGGHREDSFRPICYAAMANAFLAEITPPDAGASRAERDRMRREAIAALGYLVHSHQANGGTCLDGKPWGNQWQSAMWARSLGMAAWLLWDDLDDSLRLAAARVIEFEADRFLCQKPKSSLKNDTGAEENAWNAGLITLARCMMPRHPRAEAWDKAAKAYLYNTFSTASDAEDNSIGDDGRRVRDWVTTVNAHPDFTVENHGLVHVGYLKNSHAMLLEGTVPYVLTGRDVPKACSHHAGDVLDVLLSCIGWEGSPVYFGGNDWKLMNTQCIDVITFELSGVFFRDSRAARAAGMALDWLRRIQRSHKGYFSVRQDLEHNGLAASRLISCYLMMARLGRGVEPMDEHEFVQSVAGVRHLEHGRAILHRTPTKFASFAWGSKRLALALPREGNWVVWPHYASYLGLIDGQDGSLRSKARLVNFEHDVRTNGFRVTGTLERLGGQVTQDFAVISPEGDMVVYIERLRAKDGFRPKSRETGVIGHEYPLGVNTRTLHGRFGAKDVVGVGNKKQVHLLETDWLNVGGEIGYVVRRGPPQRRPLSRRHEGRGPGAPATGVVQPGRRHVDSLTHRRGRLGLRRHLPESIAGRNGPLGRPRAV